MSNRTVLGQFSRDADVILTSANNNRIRRRKERCRTHNMGRILMATKQKPVREFRMGRIRAAIWANQSEGGKIRFSVTIGRLYKVGNRWQDSRSYGRDDLPLVSKVTNMAHVWIWDHEDSAIEIPAND